VITFLRDFAQNGGNGGPSYFDGVVFLLFNYLFVWNFIWMGGFLASQVVCSFGTSFGWGVFLLRKLFVPLELHLDGGFSCFASCLFLWNFIFFVSLAICSLSLFFSLIISFLLFLFFVCHFIFFFWFGFFFFFDLFFALTFFVNDDDDSCFFCLDNFSDGCCL
jgi:hypothetical protein